MKKLGLISILVAGSLFASSLADSSNSELYSKIAKADTKTLSEISFEIHKRAGNFTSQAVDIRSSFRDEMQKKMSAMSMEDRAKFMQEYKGIMNDKISSMSAEDARAMGFFVGYSKKYNKNYAKGYYGCRMYGVSQKQGLAKNTSNGNQGLSIKQGQGGGMNSQYRGFGPCMQDNNY